MDPENNSLPASAEDPLPTTADARSEAEEVDIIGLQVLVRQPRRWISTAMTGITAVLALGIGLASGYLIWGQAGGAAVTTLAVASQPPAAVVPAQSLTGKPILGPVAPTPRPIAHSLQLPISYTLPITYGQLGPELVKAGVIDLPGFLQVFENSGDSLTPELAEIVTRGSNAPVTISGENAHFLLNFFWAVGLANRNPILSAGPLQQNSAGHVEQFASTGGWTLASRPITEVIGSLPMIVLTDGQQKRLEAVASAVYRPCCGNSTLFPDCNHGMAMLGMLELMAARDAGEDEMFAAAKYMNAFWFPQQIAEAAAFFKLTQNLEFEAVDPRRMVARDVFSSNGFQSVHQWLADNGHLAQPVEGGNNCGV